MSRLKIAAKATACLTIVAGCGGGGGAAPIMSSQSAPVTDTSSGAALGPGTITTTATTTSTSYSNIADSCALPDVRAAVQRANAGTTVHIPAGDCNWGGQQLTVPGGLYLKGAGQDATIIRRSGLLPNADFMLAFNCSNGMPVRLSDMAMVGNGDGSIQDNGLGLLGGCKDFKIFNSKFSNFIVSGVYVGDAVGQSGVIYNNNFIDNYSDSLKNLGYGVVVYGGGAWPDLDLGSKNSVFVEDNYFSGNRHDIASNNGAVYVFRHNTVVGQALTKDYAMTDAHGWTTYKHGTRSYEIYENQYSTNFTGRPQRAAIGIRGGDGVIFNNTAPSTIGRTIEISAEGLLCGLYPGQDQIRSLYIWNNSAHPDNGYTLNGIDNACPFSIALGRDYFLFEKPGYVPFTYPHPLRSLPQ